LFSDWSPPFIATFDSEKRFAENLKSSMMTITQSNHLFSTRMYLKDYIRKQISRQWKEMHHELTRERGVWSTEKQRQVHWRLAKVENYSRMRRKLEVNYDFNDHRDASERRDREKDKHSGIAPKLSMSLGQMEDYVDASEEADEDYFESRYLKPDPEEKVLKEVICDMIVLTLALRGKLQLTSKFLYFELQKSYVDEQDLTLLEAFDSESLKDRKWPLGSLREVHQRRYLLTPSAIELFFDDNVCPLFSFSR